MICCVRKIIPCSPVDHMTLDLDTGLLIQDCKWSNDETGEYCVYVRDAKGKIESEYVNPDWRDRPVEMWRSVENLEGGGLRAKTEIRKGNIKIVPVTLNDDTNENEVVDAEAWSFWDKNLFMKNQENQQTEVVK